MLLTLVILVIMMLTLLSMQYMYIYYSDYVIHKINEIESLHVEMHQYVLGNRGIIFSLTLVVLVLLIVISPSNVL